MSLTHGAAGSRQHIWSFVAAVVENSTDFNSNLALVCSCTNADFNWPYQVPSFISNKYFCATGNPGPNAVGSNSVYVDNPLWDGEGCGPTNPCCEFNNPPWFCTNLPQATTDDVEARICSDEIASSEDSIISLIDIYVL